jgi:hypothetical protein
MAGIQIGNSAHRCEMPLKTGPGEMRVFFSQDTLADCSAVTNRRSVPWWQEYRQILRRHV